MVFDLTIIIIHGLLSEMIGIIMPVIKSGDRGHISFVITCLDNVLMPISVFWHVCSHFLTVLTLAFTMTPWPGYLIYGPLAVDIIIHNYNSIIIHGKYTVRRL